MLSNSSLSHSLTPRRSRFWPTVLLITAAVFMIVMAVVGFLQQGRTDRVLIMVRPVAAGAQIQAADLATVELARHRPAQLAGLSNPADVVGQYAARALASDDLVQPSMLRAEPLAQPVYPNGEELTVNRVALLFSLETTGPITDTDVVNVGYYDKSGDPTRCQDGAVASAAPDASGASPTIGAAGETLGTTEVLTDTASADGQPAAPEPGAAGPRDGAAMSPTPAAQPYACRLLVHVPVLFVDITKQAAYLELTPYQAQAVRAVQAAALPLYAERSSVASAPLLPLSRLDPSQLSREALLALEIAGTSGAASPHLGAHTQTPGVRQR